MQIFFKWAIFKNKLLFQRKLAKLWLIVEIWTSPRNIGKIHNFVQLIFEIYTFLRADICIMHWYLFVYLFISMLQFCGKLMKFVTNCRNTNSLWLIFFKCGILFCINMLLILWKSIKFTINCWNMNFSCTLYLLNAQYFA